MTPEDAVRIANSRFGGDLDQLMKGVPLDEIYVHCLGAAVVAANALGHSALKVANDAERMQRRAVKRTPIKKARTKPRRGPMRDSQVPEVANSPTLLGGNPALFRRSMQRRFVGEFA